jgi:glyoxylase-like metal-dependent hydrolase (beta-lactamase superfamily II)
MFKANAVAGGEVVRYRMARVLLGKPVYIASTYRIGPLMVDTGPPNKIHDLLAALQGQRIRAILVTHGHEDHAGSAGFFPGADIRGAPGLRIARDVPFYRRVTWGEPVPGPIRPIGDGFDIGDYELRPVATPGHTPDHLAYLEPSRGWLFAGDAALGPLKYGFREEDIHDYLASLRKMRDLKPTIVFPSHGPVLDDPQEQLGAQIAHLENLRDAARRLAREGLSENAITHQLLGYNGILGQISGGEFRKQLLIRGLLREPRA